MKGERNQNWLIQCCFYYYFCMTIIIIIVIICDGGGPPLLSPSVRMGKKDHFREVVECMDRRCRGDVSWYEMWIKSQVNLKKMISVFLSLRHLCLKTSQQMILRNGGDDRSVQKYTWHWTTWNHTQSCSNTQTSLMVHSGADTLSASSVCGSVLSTEGATDKDNWAVNYLAVSSPDCQVCSFHLRK